MVLGDGEGEIDLFLPGEVEQVSSPFSQLLLTFTNSPTEFLLELRSQDISRTMVLRV